MQKQRPKTSGNKELNAWLVMPKCLFVIKCMFMNKTNKKEQL